MIRKNLWFLLILILSLPGAMPALAKSAVSADTISARRAFVEMPATVLDLLPRSTRLDMLDFFDVDSVYQAPNAMEGLSHLETVTPDYLKVDITPISSLQFKVLKDNKGADVVMTIYTTGGGDESKDSDIRFYNSSMVELPREKILVLPQLKDFFSIPPGSVTTMKEIEQMVPFYTMEFNASPGSNDVIGKITVGEFMDPDDYNIARLFEKPSIKMIWDGKKLKPGK